MLNIIVAPHKFEKRAEKYTKKIVRYLKNMNDEYSVFFSNELKDVSANVKELLSFGETEFVVVGSDEVLNEVVSTVPDLNKIKIGIVPTSKKDDLASYLGISTNPTVAIKNILNKKIEHLDIMLVNDIRVINSLLVGASVEIEQAYSNYKMKNFVSKKVATLKYGVNFCGLEITMDSKNSKPKKLQIFDLVVANGGNSNGKPVSPLSNLTDGLFNVSYSVVSNKPGKKKFIKMLNQGTHIYDEDTKQLWLNNLKITSPENKIKTLIDGKIYNLEQLNISIAEKALKIYK